MKMPGKKLQKGLAGREKLRYDKNDIFCIRSFTVCSGEDDVMAKKRDEAAVVCPKCGTRIEAPGRFCPNCAQPLTEESEGASGGGGYDYVTFGGNVPEELQQIEVTGLSAVTWLRIFSVAALLLGVILGLTVGGGDWRFNWYLVFLLAGIGVALSALLFIASCIVKLAGKARAKKAAGKETESM